MAAFLGVSCFLCLKMIEDVSFLVLLEEKLTMLERLG